MHVRASSLLPLALLFAAAPALAVEVDCDISAKMIGGLGLNEAIVDLKQVNLIPCSPGTPHVEMVEDVVDLAAGITVQVPDGDYCQAVAYYDSNMTLDLEAEGGPITKILALSSTTLEEGDATLDDPAEHGPVVLRVVIGSNPKLEGLLPTEGVEPE